MRRLLVTLTVVALASGACARAKAKTEPVAPGLDVPAPPPRVIIPVEPEPPPQSPPAEPEPRPAKPIRGRQTPARVESQRQERRIEPPPAPPADAAKPAPVPPVPTATLQPALPAAPSEIERQIREQLSQAAKDLGRVNYGGLNADGKSQYDTAKRFIEQADQALKDKNLVFAKNLAEKAAGLAGVLLGR